MPRRRIELPSIDNLKTWRAFYVTPQQLAEYWMVHPFTIHRWCRLGELKARRMGGVWRIATDDARLYELHLFAPRTKAS